MILHLSPEYESELAGVLGRSAAVGRFGVPIPDVMLAPRHPRTPEEHAPEARSRDQWSAADLHQQLLEQYAPPSIVINEEHEIVHLSARAGRFLHHGGGEPSSNLLKAVRPEELRSSAEELETSKDELQSINEELRTVNQELTIKIEEQAQAADDGQWYLLRLAPYRTVADRIDGVVMTFLTSLTAAVRKRPCGSAKRASGQ